MDRPAASARRRFSPFARSILAGSLIVSLLVLTAFAPIPPGLHAPLSEIWSPDREVTRASAPSTPSRIEESPFGLLGFGGAASSRSVAAQAEAEPGIELIGAVYNSLQDRFFRPVDSRDVLEAAWEGARRALSQQRLLRESVDRPELTGDRAGDLEAFQTQYRALIAAAGPTVDATQVAMAASDVMTESIGEQHTYFMEPALFARYISLLTTAEGRVGLGLLIQGTAAPFTVDSVVPGSPAEEADIREGDVVVAVDGRDVSRTTARDLLQMLGGGEGEPVKLTLRRSDAPVELTVVRARYKDAPLSMRVLPEGVCHLKLLNFPVSFAIGPTGRNIGGDFDYFLEQCDQADVKGWIVDLRGNGGGNAIAQTLGRFMDAGPIMVERDRVGGRYESATDGHLFRVQRPLAVLIDSGSASASEVFASAVQEHKRGVVVGERSAGALNTTIIVRLPLGAGMGVAIREVFTGLNEVVIDEVGVAPDVTVALGRESRTVPTEAIQAVLNPQPGVGPLPPGPSTFEGLLSADELKRRATPLMVQADDVSRTEDRFVRGELAFDTLHNYTSDSPNLPAARDRALRLGWQGDFLRWIGGNFPSPFTSSVRFYRDADGAHKDLREVYEPGEPQNPRQWRDVPSPVMLGDDTMAQAGTGSYEGVIWISWRRGGTLLSVSQTFIPGQPQPFDELARLAQIVDERAKMANP